jgi:hypothetical protein
VAREISVSRSTLQHWLQRKSAIDATPELVEFFESPTGVAFLHRLVVAAHFVMTTVGPCGIRLVCQLLNLTGIDQFVATSLHRRFSEMESIAKAVMIIVSAS